MAVMLEVRNLTKIYKTGSLEVKALNGIDFAVEDGEFVAIMGPSGSGKSTLLHILGCLDRPTSGEYLLGGEPVQNKSDSRLSEVRNRRIGFIFQSFNLLPRMTALQNVELPLIYRGLPAAERRRRALAALEAVGLADRVQHRPLQLSGGQQQRVAIARALVGDPDLLLADEPTGNLDSKSGVEVLSLLQALNREGRTIVMVTHDERVAAHTKRIVRLLDGAIQSDEVVAEPIRAEADLGFAETSDVG